MTRNKVINILSGLFIAAIVFVVTLIFGAPDWAAAGFAMIAYLTSIVNAMVARVHDLHGDGKNSR